jgi:hypothetical protein
MLLGACQSSYQDDGEEGSHRTHGPWDQTHQISPKVSQ